MNERNQKDLQRQSFDHVYDKGSRWHVTNASPVVRYLVSWRLKKGIERLSVEARDLGHDFTTNSSVLVMCAGEGLEGSILCDLGYTDITVSDISPRGVEAALARDRRLKGIVVDAETNSLPANSYHLVVVQDGLHHLPSPVHGFISMIRTASIGVIFLEPHDSLVGRLIGTRWERNGDSVNYVFRWTSRLVDDIANSFLGKDSFQSRNFSFWHHNIVFEKLGRALGGGAFAVAVLSCVKCLLDSMAGKWGNQFAAVLVKHKTQ